MIVLQWLVFLILLFFGGWVVLANWVFACRRRGSQIPVVGGIIVAVAFVMSPVEAFHWLWWMPLVVDLGCLPLLLTAGSYFIWRAVFRRTK